MSTPIPQPPAIPFLGNIATIDKELPLRSYELLAGTYGELYQLNMLGEIASIAAMFGKTFLISEIHQAIKFLLQIHMPFKPSFQTRSVS